MSLNRRFHDDFPVTALLLLLVMGFFVLEELAQFKLAERPEDIDLTWILPEALIALGANHPLMTFKRTELWRLLASAFLHGGILHLLFNSYTLYDLSRLCEPLLSHAKLFAIYVLCAIGSSLASAGLTHFVVERGPSVGASGAICGLIGLLLVFAWKERLPELRQQVTRWVIYLAIFSVIPGVDYAAHAGGFITGGVLGLTVRRYTSSREAALWRVPAYILGAVLAASLCMALWNYFSGLRNG